MLEPQQQGEVRALCAALAVGLRDALQEKLHALYVYGAVTFPETTRVGDIDFHAILTTPPQEAERASVLALHDRLARAFPPLGAELDGYYVLLGDARGALPPPHLLMPHLRDDSWALHRAHILAGRCIVLHGPDPRTIFAVPTWSELDLALEGELEYVARHLELYPDYCILNLCRLLYSWETRDVVTSKAAAAAWGRARFPEWARLIDLAVASYAGRATAEDRRVLLAGVRGMCRSAAERIASVRGTGC